MLEKRYGKKITEMCLVRLHPNSETGTYVRIPVADLSYEVAKLMKLRREMVKREKELFENIDKSIKNMDKTLSSIETMTGPNTKNKKMI